eukprot:TRINITY_DN196_c1_g1_i1.p3 TRINITY_DN196_c1_g1~~TRINITY_DN196_c1_g1_i1.p3  ORF type:complete len:101 (+),score=2.35 TRINITY_DN196_c1_g1_i1:85-387(+)
MQGGYHVCVCVCDQFAGPAVHLTGQVPNGVHAQVCGGEVVCAGRSPLLRGPDKTHPPTPPTPPRSPALPRIPFFFYRGGGEGGGDFWKHITPTPGLPPPL